MSAANLGAHSTPTYPTVPPSPPDLHKPELVSAKNSPRLINFSVNQRTRRLTFFPENFVQPTQIPTASVPDLHVVRASC